MNNKPPYVSIRFADPAKEAGLPNDSETQADWLFDIGDVHVTVHATPEKKRNESLEQISLRISTAIRFIIEHFSLTSDSWKESPIVWELLSFDPDVIEGADTQLTDALWSAMAETRAAIEAAAGDPDIVIENIDAVIHQTHARRKAIEQTMHAVLDSSVAQKSPRETVAFPKDIVARSLGKLLEDDPLQRMIPDVQRAIGAACTDTNALRGQVIREASPHFTIAPAEVTRVSGKEALRSQVGDVYLVRSKNVPALGDHYILIIGGLVQKPHGLRPEEIAYAISLNQITLLDDYPPEEPLILVKLNDEAKLRFHETHAVEKEYR